MNVQPPRTLCQQTRSMVTVEVGRSRWYASGADGLTREMETAPAVKPPDPPVQAVEYRATLHVTAADTHGCCMS